MFVIDKADYPRYISFFEGLELDRAIVFSVLMGQYEGTLYADHVVHPNWVFLFTPFTMHYLVGLPVGVDTGMLETFLFKTILDRQEEKELVIFARDRAWDGVLGGIFTRHKGISDMRKHFVFSEERYRTVQRPDIPANVELKLRKDKWFSFSHIDTWGAEVWLNGHCVSYCHAIMIGGGMAEIDVFTDETYRNKGYVTLASFCLIDKLLEQKLIPCWSTWPYRLESQRVAEKLGFVRAADKKAWIWVEAFER